MPNQNPLAGVTVEPWSTWADWNGITPVDPSMEITAAIPNNIQDILYSRGVDVDGFGAYGDGDGGSPHDDIPAFNNAITALVNQGGGVLRLGARVYRIASTLSIPQNVIIVGTGRYSSVIKYTGAATAVNLTNGAASPATVTNGAALMNLQILGNVNAAVGLDLAGSQNGTLVNVLITGFTNQGTNTSGIGLKLTGAHNGFTTSIPCQNNKFFGVDAINCHVGLDAAASDITQTDANVQYNEFSCCSFLGTSTSSQMYCGVQLRERARYNTFSACLVLYAQAGGKLVEIRDAGNTWNGCVLAQSATGGVDFVTTTTTPSGNTFSGGLLDQTTITTNPAWNDPGNLNTQIVLHNGTSQTTGFAGAVTVRGAGTGLAVTNNVTIGGTLSVGSTVSITGNATVDGSLTVTGTIVGPVIDKGGTYHNVDAYGAKGDTRTLLNTCSITSIGGGTTTITDNSLTAADVGKWVTVVISFAHPIASFSGPIVSVDTGASPHSAVVTGAAGGTVNNSIYATIGTDDSAAIQTAYNLGGVVEFRPNGAYTAGDLNWPTNLLQQFGNGASMVQKQINHNIISNAANTQYAHVHDTAFRMIPGDDVQDNNCGVLFSGSSHNNPGATNKDQGFIQLQDCDFYQACGFAAQIWYAKFARLINCNFYNCGSGAQVLDSYDSIVDGCIYQGTNYSGWHTPVPQTIGHQNIPFTFGAAEATAPAAAHCVNVVIRNCIVSDADNCEAYLVHDGSQVSIHDNIATNVTQGISCFPVAPSNLSVVNVSIKDNLIYLINPDTFTTNNALFTQEGIIVSGQPASGTSPQTMATRVAIVGNRIWNANQNVKDNGGESAISIGDFVTQLVVKDNQIYDSVGIGIGVIATTDQTSLQDVQILSNIIQGTVHPTGPQASTPAGIYFYRTNPLTGIIAGNTIGSQTPTTTVTAASNNVAITTSPFAPTTLNVASTNGFLQAAGGTPQHAYIILANSTRVEFTYTGVNVTASPAAVQLTGCSNWSTTGTITTGCTVGTAQLAEYGIVVDGTGANPTDLSNVLLGSNNFLPSITTQVLTVGSSAFPPYRKAESFGFVGIENENPTVPLDVVGPTSMAGVTSLGGYNSRNAPMYFSGNEMTASVRNGSVLPGGRIQGDGYYTTDPQYKTTGVWYSSKNILTQSNNLTLSQWFLSGATALAGQGSDPYGAATLNKVTIANPSAIVSQQIDTSTLHGHTLVVSFWAMLAPGGQTTVAYRVTDDSNPGVDLIATTHYEAQLNSSTLKRISFLVNIPSGNNPINPTNLISVRFIDTPGGPQGDGSFYLWRMQVEDTGTNTTSAIASPYIDNPALVQFQRPAARVGFDGNVLSRPQTSGSFIAGSPAPNLWLTFVMRSNFKSGTVANGGTAPTNFNVIWHWRSPGNGTSFSLYYRQSTNAFTLDVADVSGSAASCSVTPAAFNPGDTVVITILYSSQNQIGVSFNGGTFGTAVMSFGGNTFGLTEAMRDFCDLGSTSGGSNWGAWEFYDVFGGAGLITSNDAATIYNTWGRTLVVPTLTNLGAINHSRANPTFVWDGNTQSTMSAEVATTVTGALQADRLLVGGNTARKITPNASATPTNPDGMLNIQAQTIVDVGTASGGTATFISANSIAQPTLAAPNGLSLTATDAYTLWVGGAPTAGTGETITNSWALGVSGPTKLVPNSLTTGTGLLVTSTGVITGAGKLVSLVANSATTGTVLSISGTALTSGSLIAATAGTTTGNAVSITANGLTTGTALLVTSTGVIASGGQAVSIVANSATTGNALTISATALTSGSAVSITAGTTTGNAWALTANGLTTGTGINVASTGVIAAGGSLVVLTANSATTGNVLTISGTALTTGYALSVTGPTQLVGNVTFTGTAARTITGPSTGGLTITVASGPLTLSTTTSGNFSISSAGTVSVTGVGNSSVAITTGSLTLQAANTSTTSLVLNGGTASTLTLGAVTGGGTTGGLGLAITNGGLTVTNTSDVALIGLSAVTIAASGPQTTANAYTLFINAPTAGANETITFPYALGTNGNVKIVGTLGVSDDPGASIGLSMKYSGFLATTSTGILAQPQFGSAVTATGTVYYMRLRTSALAFTMTTGLGMQVDTPLLGAGSVVTTIIGADIAAQQNTPGGTAAAGTLIATGVRVATPNQTLTGGVSATNRALYITGNGGAAGSGGATVTNWAFYSDSTAASSMVGSLRIGSNTAPVATLDVTGTITSSGLLTSSAGLTVTGGNVSILNNSAANTVAISTGTTTGAVTVGSSGLTGGVAIAAGGASSFTVTGANLTLSTATSGTLAITSAGALNLSSVAASTYQVTGANFTIQTVTSGTLALTSAGALNLTGVANSTWQLTTGTLTIQNSGANLTIQTQVSGTLALTGVAALNISAAAASTWGVTGANLTIQTATSGTLAITSAGAANITGAAASTWQLTTGALIIQNSGANLTVQTQVSGTLAITGVAAVNISAAAASTWQVTSANLTIQTATSGTLAVTSAGALNLSASAASTFQTTSANLTIQTVTSGTLAITSAGALNLSSSAASTYQVTGANLTIQTVTSGTLALTSAGAITVTANANSTWDLGAAHTLSLQTTNNGPITTGTGLFTTGGATQHNGTVTVTSTNAAALAVGANGSTNPVLQVSGAGTPVTGVSITGTTAGNGVTIAAISSNATEKLILTAKTATNSITLNETDVAAGTPLLALAATDTLTSSPTDGYTAALRITPSIAGAQTVTRHNYIDLAQPTGAATVTNAAVFRFNAAAGTHKAVDGATTKTTPGTVDAWMKININGTIYYIPAYTSKTS